ncbi:MAG TPA: indole-3-glycerol phosphate synthase TrpC [Acidimicrobiia bacterium]|nr:indole-3-glycerol phosphate synthase TrpC [Acidimicrobiia bacterium]
MSVLDQILAAKRDEVTLLHQPPTRDAIRTAALAAAPPRDFTGALRHSEHLAVIAELKRRSPSKGDLAPDLDPAATAAAYANGGARALSVLTDQIFFGGTVDDVRQARAAAPGIPVLRKDFIIDADQVYETRAIGADAVLLIVAAVPDDALLRDLHDLAGELGLAALVETHDEPELERALALGAQIVGVNARDLATFDENLAGVARLASTIPSDVVAVAESAIRSPADAAHMAQVGFDAVLVGEALVRAPDPAGLVAEFAAPLRSTR